MDLDEIIEYFSFKGKCDFTQSSTNQKSILLSENHSSLSSTSSDESIIELRKKTKKHKKRKNGDGYTNPSIRKIQITVPEEFVLATKAKKESIREKKVSEMIELKK